MRFIRIQGMLAVAALLAVVPAYGQNATATAAPNTAPTTAPNTAPGTTPTLTPPGSGTAVPLLPDPSAGTGVPGGGLQGGGLQGGGLGGNLQGAPLPGGNFSGGIAPPTMPGMDNGLGGLGQSQDLSTILQGSASTPLTLTLGQLDSHWRRLTVSGNLDFGSVTQAMSAVLGSAGLGVYYTKGYTVTIGGATYLVAYRPRLNLRQLTAAMSGTSTAPAPKLGPQSPLSLSLLNLQTVGSLIDIRPFSLAEEEADSAAATSAFTSMMSALGTAAMSMGTAPPHPGTAAH